MGGWTYAVLGEGSGVYHTALKTRKPLKAEPVNRFEHNGCIGIAHDIRDGIPTEMMACDVVYSEIPWRHGFNVFNERAGAENRDGYNGFLQNVNAVIEGLSAPMAIVSSRADARKLIKPELIYRTRLNGADALIMAYNGLRLSWHMTTKDAINDIVRQGYEVGGDFCCGYGNFAVAMVKAGKKAVAADINAECIGVLKQRINSIHNDR